MFKDKIEGSIDIGASSIKALLLKNGKIEKADIEDIAHGAILSGNIEDHLAVTDSLKRIVAKLGLKSKAVAVSLPIQNFTVKFIEITAVSDKEKKPLIDSELEELVPGYKSDEFITDFVIVEQMPGREKLMVMTIQKEKIKVLIELLTSVKLKPVKIVPDIVSLFNLLEVTKYDVIKDLDNASIMIVDIGAESTKVFISKNGDPKMQRLAPVGGNDLNDLLQRLQNADFDRAEEYKMRLELKPENDTEEEKDEFFNEVGELIDEMNAQIKRSVDYYKMQEGVMGVEAVFLTGGASQLKGYKKVLEGKMTTQIYEFPTSLYLTKNFVNRDFVEKNIRRFDVAIGNVVEEVTR